MLKQAGGAALRFVFRIFFIFPVLPTLYLLEPFYRIRLSIAPMQRFGELSAQLDYFTRMMVDTELYRQETHIMFGWAPCNEQLFTMFQRLPFMRIIRSKWGTRIIFAWRPLLQKTPFWYRIKWDYAEFSLFNRIKSPLRFTPEEEALGRACLAEMGIGPDDWYVCLHARDDAYLKSWRPELASEWDRLSFKNTMIENYFPAIDHIVAKGGFAIRYGAAVQSPLPDKWDSRAIDYATRFRTDFMDIYLLAHARFFICTSSGPLSVATIFSTPLLVTSHFPYTHTSNLSHDMVLPRLIVSSKTSDVIPFYEALKNRLYINSKGGTSSEELGGIYEMRESTPDDILAGCKDMMAETDGQPINEAAENLQRLYGDTYLAHLPDHHLGGKVAPSWAIRYQNLFSSHT